MILLIYITIIAGIALISIGLMPAPKYVDVQIKLPTEDYAIRKPRKASPLGFIFPFSQKLLIKLGLDVRLKNKLDTAHMKLTPAEFFNLKLLSMAALAFVAPILTGRRELVVMGVAAIIGYVIPDLWAQKKIGQRKHAIARLLPETVDLLALCVEAGLDFATAAKWIIEKTPGNPMIEELAFVLEEIKWGKPRIQALKDMSKRLNIPAISSFVQTLIQAERMGTSVVEAFANLSEDARLQRFHQGERFAMQAPIKILIPLIFCILPVIAIVIGGPIMLQFVQGDLFKKF